MKKNNEERKWRLEVKQLLTSLEQEINAASKNYSPTEIERFINKKEFFEQLKEIDALLISWLKDLVYWERVYKN